MLPLHVAAQMMDLDVLQRIGSLQAARARKTKAAIFESIGIGIEVREWIRRALPLPSQCSLHSCWQRRMIFACGQLSI